MISNVLMANIFEMCPKGGREVQRLVANHLHIVFEGLSPGTEVS